MEQLGGNAHLVRPASTYPVDHLLFLRGVSVKSVHLPVSLTSASPQGGILDKLCALHHNPKVAKEEEA